MISLIVGLGNPGDEYMKTRHNAGFLLLDSLAQSLGIHFTYESKFKAEVARGIIVGQAVHLIKPQTYMNKSGGVVSTYASYFNKTVEQIIVAHDELDLDPGVIRFKKDGGHGGHNGLRDIIEKLSSKEFYRLRIGIGHPGDRNKVTNYVLKPPGKLEFEQISSAIEAGVAEIPTICAGEYQKVMQQLHT